MKKLAVIILVAIIASGIAVSYHSYGSQKLQVKNQTQLKIQNKTQLKNQTQYRNQTCLINQGNCPKNCAEGNIIRYQEQNMFKGGSSHQEQKRNKIRNNKP